MCTCTIRPMYIYILTVHIGNAALVTLSHPNSSHSYSLPATRACTCASQNALLTNCQGEPPIPPPTPNLNSLLVSIDCRVQFLNNVTSVAPLNMVLDPSNILLLNQVIGAQTADGSDTPCATFEMVVMAPSSECMLLRTTWPSDISLRVVITLCCIYYPQLVLLICMPG